MRSLCSRAHCGASLFHRASTPSRRFRPSLSASPSPSGFSSPIRSTSLFQCVAHDAVSNARSIVMAADKKQQPAPYTVFIEGNVGSGKTTFLEQFSDCPNVFMVKEPVHKWQDVRGHNFLGLMYEDPKRWSFAFQSIVQRTMLELHQARPERGQNIKIMERSIYSARNIFVENLYKDDLMAAPEYAVLDAWYKWLIGNVKIEADLIIYLRTDPEIAYQRIKTRNRTEEKNITLEYINHLHELHDKWLNVNLTDVPKNIPVVIVDANQSMDLVKNQFKGVRDLINKNALALIEPKTNPIISEIGKNKNEIQHNISPCKLVPDSSIIPAQRV